MIEGGENSLRLSFAPVPPTGSPRASPRLARALGHRARRRRAA